MRATSFLVGVLLAGVSAYAATEPKWQAGHSGIIVDRCFSPEGPSCQRMTIDAIAGAGRSIVFSVYELRSTWIVGALVAAKKAGIDVRGVVDKGGEQPALADMLFANGIPVTINCAVKLNHDKVMVIDGSLVLTGSYNWSWSAEHKNAENAVLIDDPVLAEQMLAHIDRARPCQ